MSMAPFGVMAAGGELEDRRSKHDDRPIIVFASGRKTEAVHYPIVIVGRGKSRAEECTISRARLCTHLMDIGDSARAGLARNRPQCHCDTDRSSPPGSSIPESLRIPGPDSIPAKNLQKAA